MARFTFNLPDIGEGVAEAEIVAWHVQPGDRVEEDGRLADMMTDKATVEMESPVAGKVLEVGGAVGEVIPIGSPLVVIETEGEVPEEVLEEQQAVASGSDEGDGQGEETEELAPPPSPSLSRSEPASPAPSEAEPEKETRGGGARHSTSSGRAQNEAQGKSSRRALASPAVRKRAKDMGIDLADIRPQSGERIRHGDLDAFISYGGDTGHAPAGPTRGDEVVEVVGLRRRIAESMAASKRNIPHFSYVEECDVTELENLRAQLNETRGDRPKLTLLPLLITAICRAVPEYPMINARYDDEAREVTRHGAVHMGLATMTDAGLMVPVIRNAQSLNLWQLSAEILRLAKAARSGKARPEELSGSTLTVTSLGPLGGIASTPVINRPEVAIIAPNRIVERPAFIPDGTGGERLAKRKLMNLSISCDHRVVDGYDAAAFVQTVKQLIEAPAAILAG